MIEGEIQLFVISIVGQSQTIHGSIGGGGGLLASGSSIILLWLETCDSHSYLERFGHESKRCMAAGRTSRSHPNIEETSHSLDVHLSTCAICGNLWGTQIVQLCIYDWLISLSYQFLGAYRYTIRKNAMSYLRWWYGMVWWYALYHTIPLHHTPLHHTFNIPAVDPFYWL